MSKTLAVVLVSGGMDSCVTAAIAARHHELALLHVNYGQKTETRELRAFGQIGDFFGVPIPRRLVCSIDHLRTIGGSSLTDPQLAVSDANLTTSEIPTSYVPFRNAHLLSIAVSWAEVLRARHIFIGAVEEDSSGYPDCRIGYFSAFNEVIRQGTRPETTLAVETPIIHLRKQDIVRKGLELGAPLELTWSCYRREDKACGTCDSCALRLRGFQEAGIEDPLPYIERPSYVGT